MICNIDLNLYDNFIVTNLNVLQDEFSSNIFQINLKTNENKNEIAYKLNNNIIKLLLKDKFDNIVFKDCIIIDAIKGIIECDINDLELHSGIIRAYTKIINYNENNKYDFCITFPVFSFKFKRIII